MTNILFRSGRPRGYARQEANRSRLTQLARDDREQPVVLREHGHVVSRQHFHPNLGARLLAPGIEVGGVDPIVRESAEDRKRDIERLVRGEPVRLRDLEIGTQNRPASPLREEE